LRGIAAARPSQHDVVMGTSERDRAEAVADQPARRYFSVQLTFEPLSAMRAWTRAAIAESWDLVAPYLSAYVGPTYPRHDGVVTIKWRKSGEVLTSYPVTSDIDAAQFKAHVDERLASATVAEFRREFDPAMWAWERDEENADAALKQAADAHYHSEAAAIWAQYYATRRGQPR